MGQVTALGLAFVVSVVGSLPPGIISLSVVHATIKNGLRNAMLLALGAVIVEFLQAALALTFAEFFLRYPIVERVFHWVMIPLFLGVGIYFLFHKGNRKQVNLSDPNQTGMPPFWKGMIVSGLNMLAIPFWLIYGTFFMNEGWIGRHWTTIGAFSIGAAAGTFLMLLAYGYLSKNLLTRIHRIERISEVFIGVIFMGLGVYEIVNAMRL